MTQRALTSVLCHEALHNLARRVRVGNPFLAEDTEHIAMALLGDPQLVHDTWSEVDGNSPRWGVVKWLQCGAPVDVISWDL